MPNSENPDNPDDPYDPDDPDNELFCLHFLADFDPEEEAARRKLEATDGNPEGRSCPQITGEITLICN
jgi:hypothetical protein